MQSSLVGKVYGPTEPYLVGREKIREFARAVLAQAPLSLDPVAAQAAGYADVVAPPTFAVLIAQRAEALFLFDPEAGVDFAHLVHGSERFSQERPIVAGDSLRATTTVSRIRSLGRATMIETTTEVVTEHAEPVSTVRASFVIEEARSDAA
ncbi:MAG: MaoC family dehydratase N-terminal domain-containing protein [Microbacteriaceae bacterium]|nr:MaoC family dehydratase N-terminal domain-containing protein [Microbacteriaceae bacterium]MCI1206852.1 MaoC family dehydratase N-terminal domain-containing protein [Microbacteriaceae bacterium]